MRYSGLFMDATRQNDAGVVAKMPSMPRKQYAERESASRDRDYIAYVSWSSLFSWVKFELDW